MCTCFSFVTNASIYLLFTIRCNVMTMYHTIHAVSHYYSILYMSLDDVVVNSRYIQCMKHYPISKTLALYLI